MIASWNALETEIVLERSVNAMRATLVPTVIPYALATACAVTTHVYVKRDGKEHSVKFRSAQMIVQETVSAIALFLPVFVTPDGLVTIAASPIVRVSRIVSIVAHVQ